MVKLHLHDKLEYKMSRSRIYERHVKTYNIIEMQDKFLCYVHNARKPSSRFVKPTKTTAFPLTGRPDRS